MINTSKIIAAVLVLVALALAGYAWLLSRKPPAPAAVNPSASGAVVGRQSTTQFPIVIAAKPVIAGQKITADALRVEQMSVQPQGAFADIASATGRIPVFDLAEGTPLLETQLVSGLAMRVAEGERAVSVKADEIMGVGNKVRPGDFVDVFFLLKTDDKEIGRSQARLLLSRKRVLAYGNTSVDGVPPVQDGADGKTQQQQQRAEQARTVVLAVPVDEVNSLAVSDATGRLVLALRNPTDLSEPDPKLFAELPTLLQPLPPKKGEAPRTPLEGIDKAQAGLALVDLSAGGTGTRLRTPVMASVAAAPVQRTRSAPRAAPAATSNQVEVIRGDKRETVSY